MEGRFRRGRRDPGLSLQNTDGKFTHSVAQMVVLDWLQRPMFEQGGGLNLGKVGGFRTKQISI